MCCCVSCETCEDALQHMSSSLQRMSRQPPLQARHPTSHACNTCCSVLQCVAVCCSVLQRVAVHSRAQPCVAACCRLLQCGAVCCRVLQCVAVVARRFLLLQLNSSFSFQYLSLCAAFVFSISQVCLSCHRSVCCSVYCTARCSVCCSAFVPFLHLISLFVLWSVYCKRV